MSKLKICFEVKGMAEDDKGKPAPCGMSIDFGEIDKDVDYAEITKNINIKGILAYCHMDGIVKPEDVTIITPEEYEERYGDDE